MIWIVAIVVFIMLSAAMLVLFVENMITAVVAASVVSLALTVLFALVKAPDVAMTEAAIGAGLSSLILAIALKRLGYWRTNKQGNEQGDEND